LACPDQDVVYGGGPLALDIEPVVLRMPDFGTRLWVYQVVDTRTDSFAELGSMYTTPPGFYLLVGRDWKGEPREKINRIFRSTTFSGYAIPRVFLDDTEEDRHRSWPQGVMRAIAAIGVAAEPAAGSSYTPAC